MPGLVRTSLPAGRAVEGVRAGRRLGVIGTDSVTYWASDVRTAVRIWGPDPDNVARGILRAFNICFDSPTCISVGEDRDLGDLTLRSFTLSPNCDEPCD